MRIPNRLVLLGRALSEDDDFIILEIGKHEEVEFTLGDDDVYYTVLFAHVVDGGLEPWVPWEEE